MSKKKQYELQENETIDACLDRIKADGYMPIKRIEKPIFKEVIIGGKTQFEPLTQKIIFEAIKAEG